MHFIRDGRLRRLLLTTALVVVAALGITSATSARVDVGSSGSATFALTTNDKVTLCHAAGRDGTTQFVTLTISYNAAFGQAGVAVVAAEHRRSVADGQHVRVVVGGLRQDAHR